jgi:hypothetical protein
MANYSVIINGVDRAETHVLLAGFRIHEINNGISTLVCEVESSDASLRPQTRQTIEVYEDDGSTSPPRLIFGGRITSARERGFGQPADGIDNIVTAITADDYTEAVARRFIWDFYDAQTLKTTLTSIINDWLVDDGITLDPAQADGPVLDPLSFIVWRTDDVFNFLSALTAKYGVQYQWEISYEKVLTFFQPTTTLAPWNLIEGDGTEQGDVESEPTDEQYRNKIFVVGGNGRTIATSSSFTGNGVQTSFTLAFRIIGPGMPTGTSPQPLNPVAHGVVLVNGVPETLGLVGSGADWEYDHLGPNTITRTLGPPPLGASIVIEYDGEMWFVRIAQDLAEIALYGEWEDKILAPEIEDPALAQTRADAELARRLVTGKIVRFQTVRTPAPVPGDTITITVPKRNISGAFTVMEVTAENEPGNANTLLRTIVCQTSLADYQHVVIQRWWSEKDTSGSLRTSAGAPVSPSASSNAVPGLPFYSVQWNDFGTFGGAWYVLYYDLFWSQPDLFTSPPEVKSKGLLFLQNGDIGPPGHLSINDPQRLEMGMIGEGDFSMDMFGVDASILINATGNIELTAGTPVGSPNLFGVIGITGHQSILAQIASLSGIEPGVQTIPGDLGDSFSRFAQLNVIDGLCGFYQTISSLPYTVNTTSASDTKEFLAFVNTAGTGTVFLPVRGTAGTPNYRMFPITAARRMLWFYNESGTMTLDAATVGGTTIGGSASITLGPKSSVLIMGHDTEYKLLGSSGTVTGGGASSVSPGGPVKAVQFHNPSGTFDGDSQFTWDTAKGQLALVHTDDYSLLRLDVPSPGSPSIEGGPITFQCMPGIGYAWMGFGLEIIAGVQTAQQTNPAYVWHQNDGSSPGLIAAGIELVVGETPGSPAAFSSGRGFQIDHSGSFDVYQYGGLGTGSFTGCGVNVRRNSSGNGAAAYLNLEDKNGVSRYLWVDATGAPRLGTAPPQEDGTPSDTSGTLLTASGVTVITALSADPGSPSNGDVWVRASGTTPTRTLELRIRDGGVTYTIASITV